MSQSQELSHSSESTASVVSAYTPATANNASRNSSERWMASWFGPDSSLRGLVPFTIWMALFFGGVWYPASVKLNILFNQGSGEIEHGMAGVVGTLLACFLFWTWTNIAGLCLAASALGDVCRSWSREDHTLNFRVACTRAFFVFLVVLINDIAVVGKLTAVGGAGMEAQGVYVRLAILASLFCFVASYRPEFFESLIAKFGSSQANKSDKNQTSESADSVASSQDRTEQTRRSEEQLETVADRSLDTVSVPVSIPASIPQKEFESVKSNPSSSPKPTPK